MRQPEGYATGDGRTVCRLWRSLYGLKESARKKNGKTAYILIYVHDMVIVTQAKEEFKAISENLQLVRKFIMEKTRPSEIALDPGYFQHKEEANQLLNNCPDYLSLIGGLLYVAMHQRPDIAVSISGTPIEQMSPSSSTELLCSHNVQHNHAVLDFFCSTMSAE